mmetsp:Transcript_16208/g.52974  ORF Transcript_16208/g.52974 Transcript_16208/m.52974 type:complete len:238 (+) Transcript_16208:143-856(+)
MRCFARDGPRLVASAGEQSRGGEEEPPLLGWRRRDFRSSCSEGERCCFRICLCSAVFVFRRMSVSDDSLSDDVGERGAARRSRLVGRCVDSPSSDRSSSFTSLSSFGTGRSPLEADSRSRCASMSLREEPPKPAGPCAIASPERAPPPLRFGEPALPGLSPSPSAKLQRCSSRDIRRAEGWSFSSASIVSRRARPSASTPSWCCLISARRSPRRSTCLFDSVVRVSSRRFQRLLRRA